MPARSVRFKVTPALALAGVCLLFAPGARAEEEPVPVVNSNLSAPLFYQLLIGEIELREGAAGTAYEVLLDAARKTREEQLFRRATDIALQARAGDQALAAVQAWRAALPASLEALRYQVQLLVALNRIAGDRRAAALADRSDARDRSTGADRRVAALLRPSNRPPRGGHGAGCGARELCHCSGNRHRLAGRHGARMAPRAGCLARPRTGAKGAPRRPRRRRAGAARAGTDAGQRPPPRPIVTGFLAANPDNNTVRMLYARVLGAAQRHADAIAQFEIVTRNDPAAAVPWLSLGALHLRIAPGSEGDRGIAEVPAARAGWRSTHGRNRKLPTRKTTTRRRLPTPVSSRPTCCSPRPPNCKATSRRPNAGWPRSTARSGRSRYRHGVRRCWRARANSTMRAR